MSFFAFLSVSCSHQEYTDVPETLAVEISESMVKRIRGLASLVEMTGAGYIVDPGAPGIWMTECKTEADLTRPLVAEFADCEDDRVAVESPVMRIFADSFSFSCYPKHAEDDVTLVSRRIPIRSLEHMQTGYVALD